MLRIFAGYRNGRGLTMVLFVYNNTRGAQQIPTFDNVADFCGVAERSGFSDGAMQVFAADGSRCKFRPCGCEPRQIPPFNNVADF